MNLDLYNTPEQQAKFKAARIGIAGAGGLGSNCAHHLVRAGVAWLKIVDFDIVSESNLNRQFFFPDQLGRAKVEALRDNLKRLNPELKVEAIQDRLNPDNVVAMFADCDIVVEAFDVAENKHMLITRLLPTGKKIVGASGLGGFGASNEIKINTYGSNLWIIGDLARGVGGDCQPHSPRVGIAAAMQANTVAALILGEEI